VMKYESITKIKRNTEVIDYKKRNPDCTCAEMAKIFGISRQRIHAILQRNKRSKRK
jgi:plasmid maintenance system antidote protein VapI